MELELKPLELQFLELISVPEEFWYYSFRSSRKCNYFFPSIQKMAGTVLVLPFWYLGRWITILLLLQQMAQVARIEVRTSSSAIPKQFT